MKRLVTIFPPAENVHLTKDLGLIPYVLQKHFGYHSTFASYKNGTYPTITNELKGLNQIFIAKIFNNQLIDVLVFLMLNSRKYDIVNFYQLVRKSWIWGLFFKIITFGRGKVYIKLDADERIYNYHPTGLKKIISDYIFSKIDLISIENKLFAEHLNKENVLSRQIAYIPNGFYSFSEDDAVRFEDKEDLIITVGRIGTEQKATNVLCMAFAKFAKTNKSWILEIIGPVENNFLPFLDTYFLENPHVVNRVRVTGEIVDRRQLEQKYRKTKIFAMSSRWEGFPHVFVEAIKYGCYIISSNIPSAIDITDNEKYGKLYPIDDYNALASKFKEACDDQEMLAATCPKIQDFARTNYDWITICKKIDQLLYLT